MKIIELILIDHASNWFIAYCDGIEQHLITSCSLHIFPFPPQPFSCQITIQ